MSRAVGQSQETSPPAPKRIAVADGVISFGERSFTLAHIRSFRIEKAEKSGLVGSIVSFSLFVLLASVLAELVVAQVAEPKFLMGAAVMALAGLVGLQDGWLERGTGYYRLMVVTSSGEAEAFASSEAAEVEAAAQQLAAARNVALPQSGTRSHISP
jgi:hypothetical protein